MLATEVPPGRAHQPELHMPECEMPADTVRGENGALAFSTSGSCVLNLFFELVPHIEPAEVDRLLDAAWGENAVDTLKLIFQTGNSRSNDAGKMDRENFYLCLMWLWRRHPDTLLLNLRAIPAHACLKDLLELLTGVFELSAGLSGADAVISVSEPNADPLNASIFADGVWEEQQWVTGKRQLMHNRGELRLHKQQRRADRVERRTGLKEEFAAVLGMPLDQLRVANEKQGGDKTRWVEDVKPVWDCFIRDRDTSCAGVVTAKKKERQQQLDTALQAWRRTVGGEQDAASRQPDTKVLQRSVLSLVILHFRPHFLYLFDNSDPLITTYSTIETP
jgi:hypothetical protein